MFVPASVWVDALLRKGVIECLLMIKLLYSLFRLTLEHFQVFWPGKYQLLPALQDPISLMQKQAIYL